jgi:hypothetical protein
MEQPSVLSAEDVAKFFLVLINRDLNDFTEEDQQPKSVNFRLHKLLYYAQGVNL